MKVDQNVRLQYTYIKDKILIEETGKHKKGVTGNTIFFSTAPFMFDALVTGCNKFVYYGHKEHPSLSYQPRDGSMLDIFITGEIMPSVLL